MWYLERDYKATKQRSPTGGVKVVHSFFIVIQS